jgi:hypothetical protein
MSVGSTGLTEDNLRTVTTGASRSLDDDTMSVSSNATRASADTTVSAFNDPHSNMRKEQRGTKFEDIEDGKVKGTVSLVIRFEVTPTPKAGTGITAWKWSCRKQGARQGYSRELKKWLKPNVDLGFDDEVSSSETACLKLTFQVRKAPRPKPLTRKFAMGSVTASLEALKAMM